MLISAPFYIEKYFLPFFTKWGQLYRAFPFSKSAITLIADSGNVIKLRKVMLSIHQTECCVSYCYCKCRSTEFCYAECRYGQYHHNECNRAGYRMLSIIGLRFATLFFIVRLSVIIPSVSLRWMSLHHRLEDREKFRRKNGDF
jgi:hypothetical protein